MVESNRQISSAISCVFYIPALGADKIRVRSMYCVYFSALVIQGVESDWLMCEQFLQVSTFAKVKLCIYPLIFPSVLFFSAVSNNCCITQISLMIHLLYPYQLKRKA